MRNEYDFSKGVRGKFYRPNSTFQITINLDEEEEKHPHFEVFSGDSGKYGFRLITDAGTVFTSNEEFSSQDDCIEAISQLRHISMIAPTSITG